MTPSAAGACRYSDRHYTVRLDLTPQACWHDAGGQPGIGCATQRSGRFDSPATPEAKRRSPLPRASGKSALRKSKHRECSRPNSHAEGNRVNMMAMGTPISIPVQHEQEALATTICTTLPGVAPRARRFPISLVRRTTRSEIKPYISYARQQHRQEAKKGASWAD